MIFGAVVLIGALVAGIVFGVGSMKSEQSGVEEEAVQEKTLPPIECLDGRLAQIIASSVLAPDSPGISYEPYGLIDNNSETCWAEGVPGYGEGQFVDFIFTGEVVIKEIRVMPGYKRFYKIDRYIQNGKLRDISLNFDDGSTKTISYRLDPDWAAADWQNTTLDPPIRTKRVRMTILSAYPGQPTGGRRHAEDTSVSEFHFYGWSVEDYTD